MVNGKIVLTVLKITRAKIWCAYNAPSKYSKPWQWHKKLTSFPYGNQILMQTNWGKNSNHILILSIQENKLNYLIPWLVFMKLRGDPFLFIFFSWGGGGWGGGKFCQSVPLFPTASLFPEEKKHWKYSLCYLCYRKHCIYKHHPSYVQGWYFVPLVTTLMVGQLDHSAKSLVHWKFHFALHWRQFVLTALRHWLRTLM